MLLALAIGWPAIAPLARRLTEHFLNVTPAHDCESLWRLHLDLGSMP